MFASENDPTLFGRLKAVFITLCFMKSFYDSVRNYFHTNIFQFYAKTECKMQNMTFEKVSGQMILHE